MSEVRIILAVGLPGSGKSTYFARLGIHPLSSDSVRLLLADDETDQTIHRQVFATLRYLACQRIALNRPATYIDATNLTLRDRLPWIELARENNCAIEALYFDTPPEICKARNDARRRRVPVAALDLMAATFIPPSTEEGFSRVEVVLPLPEKSPAESAG